jgi:hypothetical protein
MWVDWGYWILKGSVELFVSVGCGSSGVMLSVLGLGLMFLAMTPTDNYSGQAQELPWVMGKKLNSGTPPGWMVMHPEIWHPDFSSLLGGKIILLQMIYKTQTGPEVYGE